MRMLVVTPTSYPEVGGLQNYCENLCSQFAQQGDAVTLFTLTSDTQPYPSNSGYKTVRVSHLNRIARANMLLSLLQKIYVLWALLHAARSVQADCIICVTWDPLGYIGLPVARLLRRRFYCVALGQEVCQLPNRWWVRWLKARTPCVRLLPLRSGLCNQPLHKGPSAENLGVAAERIVIFPPGIVEVPIPADPKAPVAARLEVGMSDRRIILQVSRLVPRKAHDVMLAALPEVIAEIPNVHYVVVGDGPERKAIEARVIQSRLNAFVTLAGRVDETLLSTWYQAAEVCVLPCRSSPDGRDFEGFGIVFLESFRYGKPVVAGRSGGVEDVVVDGVNGFVVQPGDAHALANAVLTLLRDPALAEMLGQAGQAITRKSFSWSFVGAGMRAEIISEMNRAPGQRRARSSGS